MQAVADYELPSFPDAAMNVLSLLRDASASGDTIAAEIELDPNMHIQVLRVVNSAAYGLSTEVTNVQHAVALLGNAQIEALVTALAVASTVPTGESAGFDISRFWRVACERGAVARALASGARLRGGGDAFTSGLLQDVGLPVLAEVKGSEFVDLYHRYLENRDDDLIAMEREAFGIDHAEVGGMVAQAWGLPETLVTTIRDHHLPVDIDSPHLVAHLVSVLEGADDRHALTEKTVALLGKSHDEWNNVFAEALESADALFGVFH